MVSPFGWGLRWLVILVALQGTQATQGAIGGCPQEGDWYPAQDQCLHVATDTNKYTFDECHDYCHNSGATLPCITDSSMNNDLASFLLEQGIEFYQDWWIGIMRDEYDAGRWHWNNPKNPSCSSNYMQWENIRHPQELRCAKASYDFPSWQTAACHAWNETDPVIVLKAAHVEQSSTCYGGPATRAVDGATDQFTHTCGNDSDGPTEWWRMDLVNPAAISRVVVYNRVDCCSNRLDNTYVRLLDGSGAILAQKIIAAAQDVNEVWFDNVPGVYAVQLYKDNNMYLSVNEVQVYGRYDSPKAACVCQKPHPTKIVPRGPCFDSNSLDYHKCFPFKCGGVEGAYDCWDNDMVMHAPHQIEYEYSLTTEKQTIDQHVSQAAAWNGDLALMESQAEVEMIRSPLRYNGEVFRVSSENLNFYQCQDYCLSLGMQTPCLTDYGMNRYFATEIGGRWLGFTDLKLEGVWEWHNPSCPSEFQNWLPGQPDNALALTSDADCAYISGAGQKWNDAHCALSTTCVCQAPTYCPAILLALENATLESHFDGGLAAVDPAGGVVMVTNDVSHCALYKRKKQVLQIGMEGLNATRRLVPAVELVDGDVETTLGTRNFRPTTEPSPISSLTETSTHYLLGNDASSCPAGQQVSSVDECIDAGIALGGFLRDAGVAVSSNWLHTPCGCFFWGPRKDIHLNTGGSCVGSHPWYEGDNTGVVCRRPSSRRLQESVPSVSASTGSYSVSSDSQSLEIHGTQTVVFMASTFNDFQEGGGPPVTGLQFEYTRQTSSEKDCIFKFCFLGHCQAVDDDTASIDLSFSGGDLAPIASTDYLSFQQHCLEGDAVSFVSNVEIKLSPCPDNAHVIWDEFSSKPACKCNDGFRSVQYDREPVMISDQCTPLAALDLRTTSYSMSTRVEGIDEKRYENVTTFGVEMYKQVAPSQRTQVYPGHGSTFRKDDSLQVFGMQAGRWHFVHLIPKDNADQPLSIEGRDRISGSALTHCSCSPTDGADGDITGKPRNLHIHQSRGHVLFEFRDDSRCEDSYAFTRELGSASTNDENKESFTPNYYFHSKQACAKNLVQPGQQAADNLFISQLPVGQEFSYCVRATAKDYMHHPQGPTEPSLSSSNETCATHRVLWEGSIKGKVTLEMSAGSLPVEGVDIEWDFLDTDRATVLESGSARSGPGGFFSISLQNDHPNLENSKDYPVRIFPSKQTLSGAGNETTVIDHTFLCYDGTVNCGRDGVLVFLRHLQFDEPIRIVDTTSVLFAGKVLIGDTNSVESGEGCPIIGAEVCLIDKNVQRQEVGELCTMTDAFGEYRIGAVIGTRVGVEIRYHDHHFVPLESGSQEIYDQGIVIEASEAYFGHAFVDMTKTDMIVDVAGGFCDETLGQSTVEVSISGGCQWKQEYAQTGFRGEHRVPAHLLDVRVVDVFDVDENGDVQPLHAIRDALYHSVETIDLRDMEKEEQLAMQGKNLTTPRVSGPSLTGREESILTEEEGKQEEDEEIAPRQVRFQYDGTLKTQVVVRNDQAATCDVSDYNTDLQCDSIHVLRSGSIAEITLLLRYELKMGLFCDIASDELSGRIVSGLGLTEEEKESWHEYDSLNEQTKKLLDDCNNDSGGCSVPVQHDVMTITNNSTESKSRARIEAVLATGPPKIIGDFLRFVDFSVGDVGHKACFVVTGDFSHNEVGSFTMPTYEPILILRDPPGGLSYASYENVHTTIAVDSSSHESFVGFDAEVTVSTTSTTGVSACAGGGIGAIFIACAAILQSDTKVYVEGHGGADFAVDKGADTSRTSFTTTWSYKTSSDPYRPGRQSDIFVVPNVIVKFENITTISWNATQCEASSSDTLKFEVGGSNEVPALSFVTVTSIENVMIPRLEEALSELEEEKTEAIMDGLPLDPDYEEKKSALQNAVEHWNAFISEYETTNGLASIGTLDTVPSNWFDASKNPLQEAGTQPSENIWSELAPIELVQRAVALNGQSAAPEDDMRGTNRIQFFGGGGTVAFSLSSDRMTQHMNQLGRPSENARVHSSLKLGAGLTLKAPLGIDFKLTPTIRHDSTFTHTGTDGTDKQTKVSFVLGDGDKYGTDEFVVDVYTDPRYGTFIFDTVLGQSRCPHEPGTRESAKPSIEVVERPVRPVLPDEPMIFKLRLGNTGAASSGFELKVQNDENIGMLNVLANGESLARPQIIFLGAGEEIITTVAIYRGPEQFVYPSLTFVFRNACEVPFLSLTDTAIAFNNNADELEIIEFARPCPQLFWSGDLLHEQMFVLNQGHVEGNLAVTVFNPVSSIRTFEAMKNDRLERVRMQYRRVGDSAWIDALTTDQAGELVPVDFSSGDVEDPYGYATLAWSYGDSQTSDGEYEIRAQTVCTPIQGAPIEFNQYSTESITGLIDRIRPAQYGAIQPLEDVLPGEEISIHFTERIQCAKPFRFDIHMDVFEEGNDGTPDEFDMDTLNVVCEDNRIGFALDASMIDLSQLSGSYYSFELNSAKDLAGNEIVAPIVKTGRFAQAGLQDATVHFTVEIPSNCTDIAGGPFENDSIKLIVATELEMAQDIDRLVIEAASCNVQQNTLTAVVTIVPLPVGQGRKLSAESHGHVLYRALHERVALRPSGPKIKVFQLRRSTGNSNASMQSDAPLGSSQADAASAAWTNLELLMELHAELRTMQNLQQMQQAAMRQKEQERQHVLFVMACIIAVLAIAVAWLLSLILLRLPPKDGSSSNPQSRAPLAPQKTALARGTSDRPV